MSVVKLLIEDGLRQNYITKNYLLYGECQVTSGTSSPGSALYSVIQRWPNWMKKDT